MIEHQPAHAFTWIRQPWGRALQAAAFGGIAAHLYTTCDLALRAPDAEDGWARLARSVGVGPERLVRLKQVHGTAVVAVHAGDTRRDAVVVPSTGGAVAADPDGGRPRADIVMTDDPSIAVAVQVADCVPLLLADPATGAVAAVHGGWRGTAAGVARVAVEAMREHFSTRPENLLAAIGPCIRPCCYQVGADVAEAFRAAGCREDRLHAWFRPDSTPGRYRLDVPAAIIDQLVVAGVEAANIAACGLCTACHPSLFPSYRRDGAGTGRLAAVIRARVDRR